MRNLTLGALLFAAALALPGCGNAAGQNAPPPLSEKSGPHGGPAVALPGDAGYGEVVVESVPSKKAGLDARVLVFFLKPDLKSPLEPLPSDVRVKLQMPGDQSAEVTLKSEPKPKDPAGPACFASASGPYAMDQIRGELTASVGGQAFTQTFASR